MKKEGGKSTEEGRDRGKEGRVQRRGEYRGGESTEEGRDRETALGQQYASFHSPDNTSDLHKHFL